MITKWVCLLFLQLKSLEEEKDRILGSNCTLAQENVDKEPEILEKKARISELSEQGKELCSVVQEKLNTLSKCCTRTTTTFISLWTTIAYNISISPFAESKTGDNTPETVLALLQTGAAESEESSDKSVAKLLGKESTIDEFLDEYVPTRKTMHLRKLKSEKMVELIQQQKNAARASGGAGGPGGPAPYPSNFYNSPGMGGGGVPYPTGPYSMPLPGMPGMPGVPGMMYRHF